MNAQTITIWTLINLAAIILGIGFQVNFICLWNSNSNRVERWAKAMLDSLEKPAATDAGVHNNIVAISRVKRWWWTFNHGFIFTSIPAICAVIAMIIDFTTNPNGNTECLELLGHAHVTLYVWAVWIIATLIYSNNILGHINECSDSGKKPPSSSRKAGNGSKKSPELKKEINTGPPNASQRSAMSLPFGQFGFAE